ncbi:MAG TPA: sulfite exporter TauE/SafE family protein, partial [Paludibacteraceae bacterium]|nr:sulfite exporter TauE/SafE family protein [Paludibacteraceae bacterium]
IHFFQYDAKKAVATSLASLQLPVGLPSVIIYAKEGYLNLLFAALIAGGMVVGAFLGSKIGIRISSEIFKKVYGVFLSAVAVYLAIKYI